MKNNRPIEVGQVRCVMTCNSLEDVMYVIKTFDDKFVWIQEIGKDSSNKVYRWDINDCIYDTVVM